MVWTRLFSLTFGGTTYTFSIILAVFLGGIGLGGSIGAVVARLMRRPALALGMCQLLLGPTIFWTVSSLATAFAWFPAAPGPVENPWATFSLDLARAAGAILPAAILWGASFPLAIAAIAARRADACRRGPSAVDGTSPVEGPAVDGGRLIGGVYAANTIGAIAGALATSLVLIPWMGTQHTEQILIALSGLGALAALAPGLWRWSARGFNWPRVMGSGAAIGLLAAALGGLFWLGRRIEPVPFELIAYGREAHITRGMGVEEIYRGEGTNSSIAVSRLRDVIQFHVAGKTEASSNLADMRLERMLANIPAILHPEPRSVLVVGFGAGVTAGSFLPYLSVDRLVICEIEPLIPKFVGPLFSDFNLDVLHDPHVEVVYDDARHYVLTTREKFDIITSDPIHPYVKGAATLYTEEYFQQVREHLNPGGLVTQWVPLYESNVDTVKSEIATFFRVFPHATVWFNTKGGDGYDVVLLGSLEPLEVDMRAVTQRMQGDDRLFKMFYLEQVGFDSEIDLLATYAGDADDYRTWLADAEINRDGNLRLQYLAGFVPKYDARKSIYRQMFSLRTGPAKRFRGSAEQKKALEQALSTRPLGPI